jgi:ribosomal protein S17
MRSEAYRRAKFCVSVNDFYFRGLIVTLGARVYGSVRLRVVESYDPFSHPKVVRIPKGVAESLGLHDGEVVEVGVGDRITVAVVRPSRWIKRYVVMKYSLMLTLGVRGGEEVELIFRRADPAPAKKVVLRLETRGKVYELMPTLSMFAFGPLPAAGIAVLPKEKGLREYVEEGLYYLKQMMLDMPYVKGDYIVLVPDPLQMLTWAQDVIVLRVLHTDPDAPVYVKSDTEVEVV